MPDLGDSFLPRILSVFYAVFDVRQGPKILYQVPEGLIAVPSAALSSSLSGTNITNLPPTASPEMEARNPGSRNSSMSLTSPTSPTEPRTTSRGLHSPQKRSGSSNRILFNFDDISKYVIPHSALCGRLVTCSTRQHKIIGFPNELRGNYERNYFKYNLCFVFERSADLSCYEPIVRKVSRVLTNCEEESAFLSSPQTSQTVHAILEQLYEDLNSYSETSIPIDRFNSIELKIFPFYPNPPAVSDWQVPLALIDLSKRIEDNWDLTMVKVCRFIDGTNHVSRIAHLADCDLHLTRQAIAHLLYYQVIMMIDIFQYSNMYTLRKSIQWLANETHVKEECGAYVTKPGRPVPDWPKLLHLYSRLKPGKTVLEWMDAYGVHELGVDVRRFTSFGVIKGFLRRVRRWPIFIADKSVDIKPLNSSELGKVNGSSTTSASIFMNPSTSPLQARTRGRTLTPNSTSVGLELLAATAESVPSGGNSRRLDATESLEQLRSRNIPKTSSPRTSWILDDAVRSRRQSLIGQAPPPTSALPKATLAAPTIRPRLSRSPTAPVALSPVTAQSPSYTSYPPELLPLLDGEHHTDELATRFEVGWPLLEQWLILAGGGEGNGDFGQVSIIYR